MMNKLINSRVIILGLLFSLVIITSGCISSWQPPARTITVAPEEKTTCATTTTISTPSPKTPSFTPVTPSPFATSYSTRTSQPSRTPTSTLDISYLLSSDIDDERIEEVIRLVLTRRVAPTEYSGVPFCSYILLMPLQRSIEGTITAYVKPVCNEFYVIDNVLQKGAGDSLPVALSMEEKAQGWYVEVQKPNIAHWGTSVHEIFPTEIHPFIFSRVKIPNEELYQSNIQQAEQHFGLVFKPTPDIPRSITPTATQTSTPFVRVITITPTPTLDISELNLEINRVLVVSNQPEYLTLIVQLGNSSINLNLTPFEKGLVSSGWTIRLYRYQEKENYNPQEALVLDHLINPQDQQNNIYIDRWNTFLVEISLDDIKKQIGNNRDLFYQIVDENDDVVWHDDLYVFSEISIPYPIRYHGAFVVGYPKSFNENAEVYTLQDQEKFILVKEPKGGFYKLYYSFNFGAATGITGTVNQGRIEDELIIRLFQYQADGDYSQINSYLLSGKINQGSGLFSVVFPPNLINIEWDTTNKYYLSVTDEKGEILKEEYFHLIPFDQ